MTTLDRAVNVAQLTKRSADDSTIQVGMFAMDRHRRIAEWILQPGKYPRERSGFVEFSL